MERLNEGTKEAKKSCPCCGRMLPPSEWCTADEDGEDAEEIAVEVAGVRYDADLHKTFGNVSPTLNGEPLPTIELWVGGYVDEAGFLSFAQAEIELMVSRGDFD